MASDDTGLIARGSKGAFSGCTALATVDFPAAVTIGSSAFSGCTGLTELKFPRVKTIGASDNAGGGGIR